MYATEFKLPIGTGLSRMIQGSGVSGFIRTNLTTNCNHYNRVQCVCVCASPYAVVCVIPLANYAAIVQCKWGLIFLFF